LYNYLLKKQEVNLDSPTRNTTLKKENFGTTTLNGNISNTNYVNKNGKIGSDTSINRKGKSIFTRKLYIYLYIRK
jgi:hypothetical protein